MKVFKFGGASVKDAAGVRNLEAVLKQTAEQDLLVVVSAMGKMTNALEEVVQDYLHQPEELEQSVRGIYDYHLAIVEELFPNASHQVYELLRNRIDELRIFFKRNKSRKHAFVYDQVVSYGELISTGIISHYLNDQGITNTWLDVRKCIATDDYYRDAHVDWKRTQSQIQKAVNKSGITITQGFLGAEEENNFTTTLGREGSDYTAAIFGYCLDAYSVTIWKDVPGVLNADPRFFKNTRLLHHISYREAIELAFYGASVIHPKTLQPLQRKEIPLFVKSFVDPDAAGTCVGKGVTLDPMTSCFILKRNLVLLSLSTLDFSFMMEDNIRDVFNLLHQHKMKVELIQNSAISFSVCIENKYNRLDALLDALRANFKVDCFEGVTLYTVRHSQPREIRSLSEKMEVLLKQETAETVQLVVRS